MFPYFNMGDTYNWLFTELSDPRTSHLPLVSGPIKPLLLIFLYIYVVKIWLPKWMDNKEPYDLTTVINIYNVVQIVGNSFIVYKMVKAGATKVFNVHNLGVDQSMNSDTIKMIYCIWLYLCLKILDFVETAFFVMRKKNNQASFLHVYHHSSSLLFAWLGIKYVPGGVSLVTIILNSFVHVLMYTYYLLSSTLNDKMRNKLSELKKYLTILQMIQFTIIIFYNLVALFDPSCSYSKFMAFLFICEVAFVFWLFIVFYKKSYSNKNSKRTS